MVEEIGCRATFLESMRKITFCGPRTKNQGEGKGKFGDG